MARALEHLEAHAVEREDLALGRDRLGLVDHQAGDRRRLVIGQVPLERPVQVADRHRAGDDDGAVRLAHHLLGDDVVLVGDLADDLLEDVLEGHQPLQHAVFVDHQREMRLALEEGAQEIVERARTADLVVIGRRGVNERFSTGLLGGTAESATRRCPKPVLVTPLQSRDVQRPLLAYDGSARAASAMQYAAELCAVLKLPLTVLTVNRDEEQGRRALNEAAAYLQPYNVEVNLELQQTGNAPERIANFIRERNHDLLFIGAYGHSRIIEMVLGSTTEYVLRNADCPVFLYR